MLIVMFERLEADDQIHRLPGERDRGAASGDEPEVGSSVSLMRVTKDVGDDVHADDVCRDTAQEIGAVSLTTRDVEDAAVLGELACE